MATGDVAYALTKSVNFVDDKGKGVVPLMQPTEDSIVLDGVSAAAASINLANCVGEITMHKDSIAAGKVAKIRFCRNSTGTVGQSDGVRTAAATADDETMIAGDRKSFRIFGGIKYISVFEAKVVIKLGTSD